MIKKTSIFIGTKFHNHDSSFFAINPFSQSIFGMSTERKTRYKHDFIPPINILDTYIKEEKINPKEIKKIIVGYPFNTGKLSIENNFYYLHKNFRLHSQTKYKKEVDCAYRNFWRKKKYSKLFSLLFSFFGIKFLFLFLYNKIFFPKNVPLERAIKNTLKNRFPNANIMIKFYDHQLCHAISSHYTSMNKNELLFTSDGWGDVYFSKVFIANRGKIKEIAHSRFVKVNLRTEENPLFLVGSVGKIYSYFTVLLGFTENSDEGKVEALAAYGKPINFLHNELVLLFSINKNNGLETTKEKLFEVLNYKRMIEILEKNKKEDIAATVQAFLETITKKYLLHIKKQHSFNSISLSGGVAANVINNLMIYENICEKIHITPAMSDEGTSQGAAILTMIENGFTYKNLEWLRSSHMPYFGTSYSKKEVEKTLKKNSKEITYSYVGNLWPEKVASFIHNKKIGAIFHGKMEWGPRALGNRSIVANPLCPKVKDIINKKIKKRLYFQPFCPSIIEEERERLFEKAYSNKHMTCAFRMKNSFQKKLPGAIHIDGTARVQFVEEGDNPYYYRLIKKFKEFSGFGVIINTSFNKHGRTIVESPEDAVRDFIDTNMDFLMIEGFLVNRK